MSVTRFLGNVPYSPWRVALAALLATLVEFAWAAPLPAPVIAALARTGIAAADVSFFVQAVDAPKPLIAINTERLQNPASLMKLVTTDAALDLLGPAFTWRTEVLSAAALRGDVLTGDLYLRASGDPKFVWESLWSLLRSVRARGIRIIEGDLVVDRSVFAPTDDYDAALFDGDPLRAYNVGPDAFLVNYKATAFRFLPIDGRVAIAMEPLPAGAVVRNDVRLVGGPCGDWRQRLTGDFSDPLRPAFSGDYAAECGDKTWYANLFTHDQYVANAFAQLWGELGGTLAPNFKVRAANVPADARLIAQWQSAALAEQIRDINKYSNNVMARELFLALGAAATGMPATVERAQWAVTTWLASRHIDSNGLSIENGAGLSRTDRLSAQMLGKLLLSAFHAPTMPEFIASLPIIGQDGTMRKRLTANAAVGAGHIKTGSLNDVRAIGGYLLAASGRRYVVVSIINSPRAGAGQPLHDALLAWLHANG